MWDRSPIPQLCQVNVLNGKNGETRALLKSSVEEQLLTKPTEIIQKPNKNEDHEQYGKTRMYSEIPEWLQEFRENLGG